MKKIFTLIFSAIAFTAMAETVTINGIEYRYGTTNEAEGEATATQCTSELPTVVVMEDAISDGTNEYVVTVLADGIFDSNKSVTSITLPKGVKKIGNYAFWATSSLAEIKNVPDELESLGKKSFTDSNYPKTLTGDEGVYLFGGYAIGYIGNITTTTVITFPEKTKGICYQFYKFPNNNGAYNVRKVILNEGLKEIQSEAFENCYITEINIPSTVTYIAADAFDSATLKEFTVSEGNTTYAANDGILLSADKKTLCLYPANNERESYIVPNEITTINPYAFYGAYKLKELTICEGITLIDSQVLRYMGALETLHLPSTISKVGMGNFTGCSNLKNIILAATVPPSYNGQDLSYYQETTTLYVPETAIDAYKADSNWGKLLNIKGLAEYSGAEMISEGDATEVARYDICGRILSAPQKGINLVKMSNGKVKKVLVK